MKKEEYNKFIICKLEEALANHSEGKQAIRFINAFSEMCHLCDDIIDDASFRNSPEQILKLTKCCLDVYSSTFYQQHIMELYSVISVIHDMYANSVAMENSPELWKKEFADAIRNCANYMPVYIVKILVSYEASRLFSMVLVEESYSKHHNELGKPV